MDERAASQAGGFTGGRLGRADYLRAVELTQLVSVDVLLFDVEGRVLLGRRTNEPARGTWFTPGGRVYKYEPFEAALGRVLSTEVLSVRVPPGAARLHGVYRHLYETNAGDAGNTEKDMEEEAEDNEKRKDGGTDYVDFAYALNAHECYGRPELERLRAGGGSSAVPEGKAVDLEGDGQHTSFRWFTLAEVASDAEVHPYVKCYFHPRAHNRLA